MKKIFIAVVIFATVAASAQMAGAPAAAKAAFAKAYPGVTNVKWEKEDGNYEASFEQKGNKLSVIYDANGVMKESDIEIKASELSAAITSYMHRHYKGVIKGGSKITKADGTINYEAEVKGKDVVFDANGKFIKEEKD